MVELNYTRQIMYEQNYIRRIMFELNLVRINYSVILCELNYILKSCTHKTIFGESWTN